MKIERIDIKNLSKSACTRVLCGKCGNVFNAYRNYVWVRKSDQERICYDCAENYYNARKERIKWYIPREWLTKETVSLLGITRICGECEKEFTVMGDGKDGFVWVKTWNTCTGPKVKTNQTYICYECAEAQVTYRQRYGFWLRGFASEHFIPCEKCQDELHEMMMTMTVAFYTQECITIETVEANGKNAWQFRLKFLTRGSTSNKQVFRPCKECQKQLQKIWKTKELHIGSENKPAVELWRKANQQIPELDN